MQGIESFVSIGGYKMEYVVKIWVFIIGKMYRERVKKRILGCIYHYLVKLGVFFNIP
jgi:hypothetical protein